MTQVTTIDFAEGAIKIDAKLFAGYNSEALDVLDKISELKKDFAEIVETVAENTGMKKAKVAKYFNERFTDKTKATAQLGELFAQIDEIIA